MASSGLISRLAQGGGVLGRHQTARIHGKPVYRRSNSITHCRDCQYPTGSRNVTRIAKSQAFTPKARLFSTKPNLLNKSKTRSEGLAWRVATRRSHHERCTKPSERAFCGFRVTEAGDVGQGMFPTPRAQAGAFGAGVHTAKGQRQFLPIRRARCRRGGWPGCWV